MKPKSSGVWKYFTECENEKAKCSVCNKMISRVGRSTSGLMAHIKSRHKEEYENLEENNVKQIPHSSTPLHGFKRQLTMKESLNKNHFWDSSHPRAVKTDNLIGEMIAIQDLPFNFVNGVGFRRLMEAALPCYKLKGREYFTELICETMYGRIRKKIVLMLKDFSKLSFTTDIWSEPSAGVSLLSLTAHGISEDFRKVNLILKCETIDGSNSGDIVASKISSMLNEWEINEKVQCIVHDEGSNMVRAMKISNFTHINCTVHQLQLCVKSALKSQEEIMCIIAKNKKIATHFNHSVLAQEKLRQIQIKRLNQTPLAVVQDCQTRWNSTYYMMERLLKIKDSIVLYLHNYDEVSISAENWKIMSECIQILKPFEEMTRELSSSNSTISSVIPLIHALKSNLEVELSRENASPVIKNITKNLIREIIARFSELHKIPVYAMSTYLDPRFKLKFFDMALKEELQSKLATLAVAETDVKQMDPSPNNILQNESTSCPQPETSHVHHSSSQIQKCIEIFLNTSDSDIDDDIQDVTLSISHARKIVAEYNKERKIHISEDPLLWWKRNSSKYKNLVPLVRQFLATPPGSVPCEQLFSGAGLIYDPLRTKLNSENAAKLLFIKYNFALLNFEY